MKRKISLCNPKSGTYIFSNFLKQYKKSLHSLSIGEMLNSKQLLSVLSYMGFTDEEPSQQDIELARTLTRMLSNSITCLSVTRANLFTFFMVLCDIPDGRESEQGSMCEEEASGLAMDDEEDEEPLVLIDLGSFDQSGRWYCSEEEKDQIKKIFASMRSKRISRNEIEARKRSPKK